MGEPLPNVLITGTPGTGKTTLARRIAEEMGGKYEHVEVSQLARDEGYVGEYDAERATHVLDEDRLLDALEPRMARGGVVADYHASHLFPERWFQLVLVLRCDNTALYDRLAARGYAAAKISENVEAEILQVLLDEARESYDPAIVHELRSDSADDLEQNIDRAVRWLRENTDG